MIRCPTCGTLNQDSLRSCSNCGKTLPQTKVRCPECGTSNSIGNLFCDRCNARLIHSEGIIPADLSSASDSRAENAPVKGISLPTRAATSSSDAPDTGDDELPDWLRSLTEDSEEFFGTADEPESPLAEELDQDAVDTSSDYPDWLSGLLNDSEDVDNAQASDDADSETQAAFTLESDALPDWFAGMTASDDDLTPDADNADSLADLPSWLSATADTSDVPTESPETLDLPSWLTASAESTSGETPIEAELPDWLLGISDKPVADDYADTQSADTQSADTTDEALAWGEGFAELRQESTEGDYAVGEADSEPLAFSESELPDWLTEAQALTADTTGSSAVGASPKTSDQLPTEQELSVDLPDWLSVGDENEDSGGIELPQWLQTMSDDELQEPSSREAADLSSPEHTESPETRQAASGAYDEAEESEETEGLPVAEPEVSAAPPEPAELPDWLSGFGDRTTAPTGAAIFSSDDELPEELVSQPQERPSWLKDIKPTETPPYESAPPTFILGETESEEAGDSTSTEDTDEMPEWLRGLDIAEPKQAQVQPDIFEGNMPARAELPGWLQELKPQDAPSAGGAGSALGTTDELANADIPDWLQALRPEPSKAGEPPPRRGTLPTPAEREGPLEGLPGVLHPFALVDAPADAKAVTETALPEAVIAQAQLWQKLLEQPRSGERPVSHIQQRSTTAATLVHLLVAAVLILGVLGAFLLLPEGVRLSPASPAQLAPGATELSTTLDELQPGDRVIVAVEYGMAYAEEMSQIATPILQHLAARQAEITIVSTLPEGAALGVALANETLAEPARLQGGYLSGNASGISAFLSQPDAQVARHVLVLASQPERLRWWIEQVQLAYDDKAVPVSLSVGASASAGPIVAPYLQTSQVQGWLVGFPDALAYRELRGVEDTADAARTLDVLMLAHWAAGGLLVIGLLTNLVTGKKGAR